ncbi:MAG: hypothetical protein EBU32_10625 [Opitutaceae bacterium]|nr:hypothetical protein [Opitutaceae bacterium]
MKSSLLLALKLIPSFIFSVGLGLAAEVPQFQPVVVKGLRCEYLSEPEGIDVRLPRLSWRLESERRGIAQIAAQIRVASNSQKLTRGEADLWDSGRVDGAISNQVVYAGRNLVSRTECFWQVRIWDEQNQVSTWSPVARWTMGLLQPSDWTAAWIAQRDHEPLHTDRAKLYLPSPRHFRKEFAAQKTVQRAVVHASALGLYDLYCNGQRVGDAFFQPGWSDYLQRAYYRSHDVTALLRSGASNVLGAVVADGWYAGYVGYGLLVGYGPNKVGRYFYGKTPALRVQLEIDYTDGTRETLGTDTTWLVTDRGPTREARLH